MNNHARNAVSSPSKRVIEDATAAQVSERDVLGRIAGGDPQVAEERRLVLVPEGGERRRVARHESVPNTVGKDVPIIVPP